MLYFVRILSRVEDIFFSVVRKFFFLLNVKSISISKPHKNSIPREEFSYKWYRYHKCTTNNWNPKFIGVKTG